MRLIDYVTDDTIKDWDLIVDDKLLMGCSRLIKRLALSYSHFKEILIEESNKNDNFIENVIDSLQEAMIINDGILGRKEIYDCIKKNEECDPNLLEIFQYVYKYMVRYGFSIWEEEEIKKRLGENFYIFRHVSTTTYDLVYSKNFEEAKKYHREKINPDYYFMQKIMIKDLKYIELGGYNSKDSYLKDSLYECVMDFYPDAPQKESSTHENDGLKVVYIDD